MPLSLEMLPLSPVAWGLGVKSPALKYQRTGKTYSEIKMDYNIVIILIKYCSLRCFSWIEVFDDHHKTWLKIPWDFHKIWKILPILSCSKLQLCVCSFNCLSSNFAHVQSYYTPKNMKQFERLLIFTIIFLRGKNLYQK